VFLRDQHIVMAAGLEEAPLLGLAKIKPATAKRPEALLAAAAASWALDVPTDLICAGLRTYDAAAATQTATAAATARTRANA
jgi:cyanophycin synthetase